MNIECGQLVRLGKLTAGQVAGVQYQVVPEATGATGQLVHTALVNTQHLRIIRDT